MFKLFQLPLILFILELNSLGNSYVHPQTNYYDLQEVVSQYEEKQQWPKSVEIVDNWPAKLDSSIIEYTGISICPEGKVHILHRAERIWTDDTFNDNNVYNFVKDGPIKKDTIHVYDPDTGKLLSSRLKNKLYFPHSVTIDKEGNTWITDVGLHQVLKYPTNSDEPSLILGQAFEPGKSDKHFCKPTKVVVASDGAFFVSDGYCNARVMKFYPNGTLEQVIGLKDWLTVPHDLSLDEESDRFCVADRENYRIICYSAGLAKNTIAGIPLQTINAPNMGRPYAIALAGDNVFAAVGQSFIPAVPSEALLFANLDTKSLLKYWKPPQELKQPHQMVLSSDNKELYLVDVDAEAPVKIYKLKLNDK